MIRFPTTHFEYVRIRYAENTNLFTVAKDYLKGVMNGKTAIPTKTWKTEYAKPTAERNALKGEVKEAEQIRKSVYSILR